MRKETPETPFYLKPAFLSKIPGIGLVSIFLLPAILVKINPKAGLFFIAFCISYWTVKVFESYYYVLSSYLALLRVNRTDFLESEIMLAEAG